MLVYLGSWNFYAAMSPMLCACRRRRFQMMAASLSCSYAPLGTVKYCMVSPNYNGVAFLVRDLTLKCDLWAFDADSSREVVATINMPSAPTEVRRGFPDDPVPDEARVLSACVGKIRLVNVYVINGQAKESDQFELKGRWMAALGEWLQRLPETPPLLVVGDFNVAPDDRDVWDSIGLKDRIHCTDEERMWLKGMQGSRLRDLLRVTTDEPGIYTWWPYQRDAFECNEGAALEFWPLGRLKAVVSLVKRVWVDREERKPIDGLVKPSDHAPVIIDLDE